MRYTTRYWKDCNALLLDMLRPTVVRAGVGCNLLSSAMEVHMCKSVHQLKEPTADSEHTGGATLALFQFSRYC